MNGSGSPLPAIRTAGIVAFLILAMSSAARATMTLTGDPASMSLTAREVPRDELLGTLTKRFGVQITGQIVAGGDPVTGHFRGDLGEVLARVLAGNNFLIVYEGGKPVRVLLSERGASAAPIDPAMRALQQGGGVPLGGGQYIDPETYAQPPIDGGQGLPAEQDVPADQGLPAEPFPDGVPADPPADQF